MKPLISYLLLSGICFCVRAQAIADTIIKPGFYNAWTKMMESDPDDKWHRFSANTSFQLFERSATPRNASAAVTAYYGNATLSWLNGQAFFELAAAGITKANADSFLYHVVVNDSMEIVPWQHPASFRSNSNGTYAYLGKFESGGKLIKIELYHMNRYYDKKVIYFNNLYAPKPEIVQATLFYNHRYLFHPHKQHYIPASKQKQLKGYSVTINKGKNDTIHSSRKEINHQSFEWNDSIHHIRVSMKPTLLNDMYYVYLRHYSDQHSDTIFISNKWNLSYYSKNPELLISSADFKKPGNYEVIIRAELPEEFKYNTADAQTSFFFSVQPSSIVQFSPKQLMLYTAFLTFIGGTGFFYYRGRNKRQLEKKTQEKQMALLQLRAVRSQLNPHFMFNALSGIQNLMNKNESEKASNYLSRFARITRHILKESEQDVTSIQDEIKLLEDYLLMEQLRFGFQYKIIVAESIGQSQADIPAMLLQPLVENAVKHGVSGLSSNGIIGISITQEGHSLLLQVKDNGKGFSLTDKTNGSGLKLVSDRIQLLNKLYPDTTIHFEVLQTTDGCICQVALNNWL